LKKGKSEGLSSYSPIAVKNHGRTNSYRNSINEYESVISMIKKTTGAI
jgi:hypothetical protein